MPGWAGDAGDARARPRRPRRRLARALVAAACALALVAAGCGDDDGPSDDAAGSSAADGDGGSADRRVGPGAADLASTTWPRPSGEAPAATGADLDEPPGPADRTGLPDVSEAAASITAADGTVTGLLPAGRGDRRAASAGPDGGDRPRWLPGHGLRVGRRHLGRLLDAQHPDATLDRLVRRRRRLRVVGRHGAVLGDRTRLPRLPVGRARTGSPSRCSRATSTSSGSARAAASRSAATARRRPPRPDPRGRRSSLRPKCHTPGG